jgi:hypothetical protein
VRGNQSRGRWSRRRCYERARWWCYKEHRRSYYKLRVDAVTAHDGAVRTMRTGWLCCHGGRHEMQKYVARCKPKRYMLPMKEDKTAKGHHRPLMLQAPTYDASNGARLCCRRRVVALQRAMDGARGLNTTAARWRRALAGGATSHRHKCYQPRCQCYRR